MYSKHVQDIYWNKFKKKMHLVGSYYANLSRCTVHIMSNCAVTFTVTTAMKDMNDLIRCIASLTKHKDRQALIL